tara:strand:- start:2193 stop:2684 length:492 start_codon:yes stop_codon:yes gene_type:complete
MKYLKRIFEDVKPESYYKEMLDNILMVDKIVKQDFLNIFRKHNATYRINTTVKYLTENDIFDISNNTKYTWNNYDSYLDSLTDQQYTNSDFELSDCTLFYNIGTHTISKNIPDNINQIIETLERKYNYVLMEYRPLNYSNIEVHYNLSNYVDLIGNNYKKINK